MPTIDELWQSPEHSVWTAALDRYWCYVQPANLALETSLDQLDLERIRSFDAQGWYDFLFAEYFRWKYTTENRYKTTTVLLSVYAMESGGLDKLHAIKNQLLQIDPVEIRVGLLLAKAIHGLGVAGASGLLALLYPGSFATVDQFVVKALRGVAELPEADELSRFKNPTDITIPQGVTLIGIMRRKAEENNRQFGTTEWTPRKIDQILWTYGRDAGLSPHVCAPQKA